MVYVWSAGAAADSKCSLGDRHDAAHEAAGCIQRGSQRATQPGGVEGQRRAAAAGAAHCRPVQPLQTLALQYTLGRNDLL